MNNGKSKKKQTQASKIRGYDFRFSHEDGLTAQKLILKIRGWFKVFVFQLEQGESGYKHWQCRGKLHTSQRPGTLVSKLSKLDGPKWLAVAPTSCPTYGNSDFDYVMKEDTRLEGPYKDTDYKEPQVLTSLVREYIENVEKNGAYKWQKQTDVMRADINTRSVNIIVDYSGNSGKSSYTAYARYTETSIVPPQADNIKEQMGIIMGLPTGKSYIFDLPRGVDIKGMKAFFGAIETLKNGVAYDGRYTFTQRIFDPPSITVFCNALPPLESLSKDRWNVWMLEDKKLVKYDLDTLIKEQKHKANTKRLAAQDDKDWENALRAAKKKKYAKMVRDGLTREDCVDHVEDNHDGADEEKEDPEPSDDEHEFSPPARRPHNPYYDDEAMQN
jgi:hypothetical protein